MARPLSSDGPSVCDRVIDSDCPPYLQGPRFYLGVGLRSDNPTPYPVEVCLLGHTMEPEAGIVPVLWLDPDGEGTLVGYLCGDHLPPLPHATRRPSWPGEWRF